MNINKKRRFMGVIAIVALFVTLITGLTSSTGTVNANLGLGDKIACRFEDGKPLVKFKSTDHPQYLTRSKSALATNQGVNSTILNKFLGVAGFDFNTPNEAVLGREIRPDSFPEEPSSGANDSAPKVSAFDRFGMAGMNWSSYQGEWKYNNIEPCASQGQVSPTTYGTFYESRLEPKSTYNERSTSKDPRSIQHNKGVWSALWIGFSDIISNFLFSLTKLVVTLTIVFVGLSFTDITSLIGMTSDGVAGPSATGMFTDIFNNVFSSFIVIAFISTGVYIMYKGLVKREVRYSLNTLLKTIGIFFVAMVIASDPGYWVGMPNRAATFGQAIALNSMAGLYENDVDSPSLCSTDVSSVYDGVESIDVFDDKGGMGDFEKVSNNMKSIIGCQMWETLTFRPWVRGQFGADYEDLFDENLDNINKDWVGNGSVPVGNGQTIDNWALFHLSTQTDAHAQVGESNFPTIINGVSADWWRTVDALSNYDEEEVTDSLGVGDPQTFMDQVNSDPTSYWQSWVGNNNLERFSTSIIAIIFGVIGSIAPLSFAISTSIFGLGITLLMIVSPLFLLMGAWGGIGNGIFEGWLSSLINTVIKRVATSILLVLSISITMSIMNLVYTIGFIKAFLLMVVVTSILVKNKNKMLDMIASVDLGGAFDPRTKASQLMNKQKTMAVNAGRVGATAAVGATYGARTGQGALKGAGIGAGREIRNRLYTSQVGAGVIREYDSSTQNLEGDSGHHCIICFIALGVEDGEAARELAYRDDDGNYYCVTCADEMGTEELYAVRVGNEELDVPITPMSKTRTKEEATNSESYISQEELKEKVGYKVKGVNDDELHWDNESVEGMIKDNIDNLHKDMATFTNMKLLIFHEAKPPKLPEPLHEYIDLPLINKAWTDGELDVVEETYREAWAKWYEDTSKGVEGIPEDSAEKVKDIIENYEPDIDDKVIAELVDTQRVKVKKSMDDKGDEYKDNLYVYRNGVLKFNRIDRYDFKDDKDEVPKSRKERRKEKREQEDAERERNLNIDPMSVVDDVKDMFTDSEEDLGYDELSNIDSIIDEQLDMNEFYGNEYFFFEDDEDVSDDDGKA